MKESYEEESERKDHDDDSEELTVMLKDEIGINLNDQMNPEEDVTAKMNINNFLVLVSRCPI